MVLRLTYTATTNVPVEVERITPDLVGNQSLDEICRLSVYHGNREMELAELFEVAGDPTDGCIEWEGELSGVHWIGAHMMSGRMHVRADAGRHLGSEMRGGEIHVEGDAGDWVGGEMHGGLIHVKGRAGHLIGAAYRGSPRGMTGGTILIQGDVGNEIGHSMRRGLLAVGGNAGDLAGFNMLAGSILVFGNGGIRHGAGMRRGTIGFFGTNPPEQLPSFRLACRYRPVTLPLIAQTLCRYDFDFDPQLLDTEVDLYNGDLIEGGRGEMLVRA